MFREMRRIKQQISQEECIEILTRATSGVLALSGDDGYSYAVPVSFAYEDGKICFHGAKKGHKVDAIRKNDKVSFCVIDQDVVMPRERTTKYCSVIAFGRARILEDPEEIRHSAVLLGEKYSHDYRDLYEEEIEETMKAGALCCVEITIEYLTGKIGRQLMLERQRKDKQ